MTERSDDYRNEAIPQLAQAWSRRSPAERAAFSTRPAPTPAHPQQLDTVMRTVRERAALSGAVTPTDLASGLDRGEASHVLDLLAPEFDRVNASGRWMWTLRTAARLETLAGLTRNGGLAARLAEVARIRTDPAGELLRQLAEIRSPVQTEETDEAGSALDDDPATAVQALTWARPLGGFDGDLAEAQRRAAVRSLSEGYGLLTQHGVYGRDQDLAKLRRFALEPIEGYEPGVSPVPVLTLTGIGGAGKSTVLGAFLQPILDQIEEGVPGAPAVVVLDFDRILLRPNAELELSFELTRQLGYAVPVAAADFSVLRYQLRDEKQKSGSDRHVSNVLKDSTTREVSAFEHAVGSLVELHGLHDRQVLLVLDTFEEWQREHPGRELNPTPYNSSERRILDWIGRIRSAMKLRNLRVVVSGRATLFPEEEFPGQHEEFPGSALRPQLTVGELAPQPARDLLGALGVAAPDAARLADFVDRNPLTLYVTARFYQGLDADARRELLAGEPLAADELTAEIRKAVLYQRFLEHIPDTQIRKLAHPGLLLRRITPELVRNVLAGPCGLGRIDARQAKQLTDKLADEVWLVQRTPRGLYHRREVRGPMLKLMASDPAYLEVSRQIHAAAVKWYENNGHGRDRLPRGLAEVEGFYHSLMLESGDEALAPQESPAREQWLQLAQELRAAVDELPAKVAAQVHFERGDRISDQDAALLPGPVWRVWVAQRGRALVDDGEPAAALKLFDSRPLADLPECLGQACSDAAQWDRYWPTWRELGGHEQSDLSASGRYGLLNALLSGNPGDLANYRAALSAFFSQRELAGEAEPDQASAERLFCRLLLDRAIGTGPPRAALPPVTVTDEISVDRFPVDQLRRLLTWIGTPSAGPDFVIENVASFYRPDPQWMQDFAVFAGADSGRTDLGIFHALSGDVASGASGLSTYDLLGGESISYAGSLGSDAIRLWRSGVRDAAGLLYVLRGDNPELRPAIRLALAGVASGTGIGQLAAIAEQLAPVWAADLRPSVTGDGDRRILIQLVEYVDRSGFMREFLAETRQVWPDEALLRRVADAFDLWDDANNRLLDTLAEQLRRESGLSNA